MSTKKSDCQQCHLRKIPGGSRGLYPLSFKESVYSGVGRNLSVPIGVTHDNLIKEMEEKIDTERGREIYHRGIGIAEPVFANIKYGKGLNRFTLNGS